MIIIQIVVIINKIIIIIIMITIITTYIALIQHCSKRFKKIGNIGSGMTTSTLSL